MAFIMPLTFSVWNALLNNFAIEHVSFSGREIGILHSLREIPGFLAFTAIFVLLILREQVFALASLLVMSVAIAATGYFPSVVGLYATTVIMSMGFHYFETINQSLTLQFLPHGDTAHFMGRALAVKAVASLLAYGSIWLLMGQLGIPYKAMYLLAGGLGLTLTLLIWFFLCLGSIGLVVMLALTVFPQVVPEGPDGFILRGMVRPSQNFLFWTFVQAARSIPAIGLLTRGYQVREASYVAIYDFSLMIFAAGARSST